MSERNFLRSALAAIVALLVTVTAVVSAAAEMASESPDARAIDAEPLQLEELVVTGTRIRKPTLVSSSPLVRVEAEEVSLQGTVRVEDMLRSLPQVYAGQSNGAVGTATLNLRNLGTERTLVLVNGRRLPVKRPAPHRLSRRARPAGA